MLIPVRENVGKYKIKGETKKKCRGNRLGEIRRKEGWEDRNMKAEGKRLLGKGKKENEMITRGDNGGGKIKKTERNDC